MDNNKKIANLVAKEKKAKYESGCRVLKSKLIWIIKAYGALVCVAFLLKVVASIEPQLKVQMPEFYRNVDLILASMEEIASFCNKVARSL